MECQVLSEISWPLVLSTNYDTMFTDTYAENEKLHGNSIKVFGREPKDCHSLLASLNASTQTAYWALQGYFGNNYRNEELGGEIVVGYRQYRNATFNNMTFRSVFGEVFRNNSFLFLGTGLSEDYFRGLFGEVLEKFGSNPHSHCALFREQDFDSGLVDHHFLNTKLNIIAISYKDPNDDYSGLHTAIQQLRDAFRKERNNLWKLSFGSKNISQISDLKDKPSLEIIAGTLPHPKKSECVIISAGYDSEGVRLSHYGKRLILACLKEKYDSKKFISKKGLVSQYGDTVFYAAIARNIAPGKNSKVSRDLRKIAEAVEDVLRETNGKFEVISMMLLGVGSGCNFPPVFSLIQMIRGYKTF